MNKYHNLCFRGRMITEFYLFILNDDSNFDMENYWNYGIIQIY